MRADNKAVCDLSTDECVTYFVGAGLRATPTFSSSALNPALCELR